ncbi:MAG: lamin tail domain-containing protein [Bacteroidota bacterium]|nr:lamin tail domain-containing protein [Bacteroidota bacterium]
MRKKVPILAVLFICASLTCRAQQLRITEMMAVPLSGEAEWVELYNAGPAAVSLKGWSIEDRTGKRIVLGDTGRVAAGGRLLLTEAWPPGTRWTLSSDSALLLPSLPSLNNSGDDIVLRDSGGTVIDSAYYAASWLGDKGVSLERVDVAKPPEKSNWLPCTDATGGTPCARNSVAFVPREPLPPGALRLNEIMYEPLTDGSEWVEILSRHDDSISVTRLTLSVATTKGFDDFRLPASARRLPPGGMLVVAADSSILTRFPAMEASAELLLCILGRASLGLANDGDAVLLRDDGGGTLDSCAYEPEWHHPFVVDTRGRSLERLHPELPSNGAQSWSSCTAPSGGTPGAANSTFAASWHDGVPEHASLVIAPLPFSPDGDGYEDFCTISCRADAAVQHARLRIYDIHGRLVRTLLAGAPMASRLDITWDGLDDAGRRVRIGPYVALLDLLDTADNAVQSVKGIIVVARKL